MGDWIQGTESDLEEHDNNAEKTIIKDEPKSPVKSSATATGSKKQPPSAFRRDFKIHGDVNSKSGLSFISLVRYINTGLEKGYFSSEITDAVIRALHTNTGLKKLPKGTTVPDPPSTLTNY